MNSDEFLKQLAGLADDDLQALGQAASLYLMEDARLEIAENRIGNCLDLDLPANAVDGAAIRSYLVDSAASLIESYYRVNPLSEEGFASQVRRLLESHGERMFAAVEGERADITLFVDGGQVVAETAGNPRHPYGSYLELAPGIDEAGIVERVRRWLESGEAYRQYLSMNVCRYNC